MSANCNLRGVTYRSLQLAVAFWWLLAVQPSRANSDVAAAPPQPATDEILLISTRSVGISCDARRLQRGLDCRKLHIDQAGQPTWTSYDWHHLLEEDQAAKPTVIYVHGNRVAIGADASEGLMVYDSLVSSQAKLRPLRFIIWSWPSSQIPRPVKDYQVKAVRTNTVAWQLAWLLDQLPIKTPLSLVGYSYGARTVSGSMHLLAGGNLGPLRLSNRTHPVRPPIHVGLMAAAFDADWLVPGEFHQRALAQIDKLVVVTNRLDPAMRFFRLSTKRSREPALGWAGIDKPKLLGNDFRRVHQIDVTSYVGRSHIIDDYLAAEQPMEQMWRQLLNASVTKDPNKLLPAYAHLNPTTRR